VCYESRHARQQACYVVAKMIRDWICIVPLYPGFMPSLPKPKGMPPRIVFVDLNGWQHRATPSSANKRLPRSCEFTETRMHIYETRLRSVLQSLTSRCDSR